MNKPSDRDCKFTLVPTHPVVLVDHSETSLVELVRQTLEGDEAWIQQTQGGSISVIQFLAVVLLALSKDETTPDEEALIVNDWAKTLLKATTRYTNGRLITPTHPVTYLPLPGIPQDNKWIFSIDGADDFLESLGMGFRCTALLSFLRGDEKVKTSEDKNPLTYPKLVELRNKEKGSRWSDCQLQVLKDEVGKREGKGEIGLRKSMAKDLGITVQALNELLKRKPKRPRFGDGLGANIVQMGKKSP